MALWKPFRGNRADLDAVEKHDGYVYFCVDDATLFFDYTDADGILQRKQISAKDAETITGVSLEELKNEFTNQDAVVLAEAQAYADNVIEAAKSELDNQDVVVLREAQAYTDNAIANIDLPETDFTDYYTKAETDEAINAAKGEPITIEEIDAIYNSKIYSSQEVVV